MNTVGKQRGGQRVTFKAGQVLPVECKATVFAGVKRPAPAIRLLPE